MPTPQQPPRQLFPNPFYVLLIVVSTLFVLTTLAYLVAPTATRGGRPDALGSWVERNGPTALGIEFVIMLAAGLLAMATDRWFPGNAGRRARTRD